MPSIGGPGRRSELDGLRALAIGGVIAIHDGIGRGGHLGVSVFFVLSGYLITTILARQVLNTGSLHFGRFYARRVVRLVPALVLALIGTSLILTGLFPAARILAGAAAAFTYTSNLFLTAGVNGHTTFADFTWPWTLAMEEQFYLLWPFALLLLMRRSIRTAETAALVGFVAWTALRFVVPFDGPVEPAQLYFSPYTRASGLMLGCWLALVLLRKPAWSPRLTTVSRALAVPAVVVILVGFWVGSLYARTTYTVWLTGTEAATALLICAFVTRPAGWLAGVFAWWPLAYIGRISYGIYLWNVGAIWLVDRLFHPNGRTSVLEWGPLTLLLAVVSFHLLEKPLIDWLHERQRASQAEVQVAAP